MKKIYLSGGTVSDWQDVVIHACHDAEFYNPARFKVGPVDKPGVTMYSPMDKLKIEECDILFAYLEASNPTPINVALELGYAKGLGKITILCNEWTEAKWKANVLGCQKTTDPKVFATWYKPWYVALLNSWADFQESDFGLAQILLKQVIEYD